MDIRTSLVLLSLGGAALTGCVSIGASSRPPVKTPAPRLILQELPRETGVPLTVQASVMGLTHCVLTVTATGGSRGSTTLFHGADTDGPHSAARTANDAVLVIVPSDTRQLKGVAVCRYERNKVTHRVHLTAGISV